jgi:hypothetical protein
MSVYSFIPLLITIGVIIYAFGFTTLRNYKYESSVPTIGTNDDNINHIALSALSIKENNLLFTSPTLKKMYQDGIFLLATRWYPYGLYANVAYFYHISAGILSNATGLNAGLLFTVQNLYIMYLLVLMIIGIYALTHRLYSTKSILSLPVILPISIMIVVGQFFLKLLAYGFHTQMLGYIFMLALLVSAHHLIKKSKIEWSDIMIIGICTFALGVTYYLFIPFAFVILFLVHVLTGNKKMRWTYPAWVLSTIPLIYFNCEYRVTSQLVTFGVSFIQIDGFILCMIAIVVAFILSKATDSKLRLLLTVLVGMTLGQMLVAASLSFAQTNNLSYYFYKSYWTLGVCSLPVFIAVVQYIFDQAMYKKMSVRAAYLLVGLFIGGAFFFSVFRQNTVDSRGYDMLLIVRNGYLNYFDFGQQKKWIDVYNKHKGTNGSNIYPTGLWGWVSLSYVLNGGVPNIYKVVFPTGIWNFGPHSAYWYMDDIAKSIKSGGLPIILDGRGFASKYRSLPDYKDIIKEQDMRRI